MKYDNWRMREEKSRVAYISITRNYKDRNNMILT